CRSDWTCSKTQRRAQGWGRQLHHGQHALSVARLGQEYFCPPKGGQFDGGTKGGEIAACKGSELKQLTTRDPWHNGSGWSNWRSPSSASDRDVPSWGRAELQACDMTPSTERSVRWRRGQSTTTPMD